MTKKPDPTPSFDLTAEPWITANNIQGRPGTYSLIELLRQAPGLREITDPNPLTIGALMRLLLAILHRAINGPRSYADWSKLWNEKSFEQCGVIEYLEGSRERFDLFSEVTPFYQTAGFTAYGTKGSTNTAVSHKLTHDLATGNNKTLFDHSLDEQPLAMTPAQAARGLLTTQLYGLGGGQGPISNLFSQKHPNLAHAPLIAGALVFLRGDNLFETLMLNLLRYDADRIPMACIGDDRPIWERDDLPTPGEKIPTGYLEYLTWRSRHIRLLPEWDGGEILVWHLYIAQAESFPRDFQVHEQDPMFAYRETKDGGLLPLKLQADRALWRDSASLFEYSTDEKKGNRRRPAAFGQLANLMGRTIKQQRYFRCFVIGLVNAQANPLLWRMEEMSPPVSLLEDRDQVRELRMALQRAETVSDRLCYCTRVLAEALLTLNRRSPDKKDLEKMENTLRTGPDYWAALEGPFYEFLKNPNDEAERQWADSLFTSAREAMERGAAQYVASSARDLQAQVKGMACLNASLRKLKDEWYPQEEEVAP